MINLIKQFFGQTEGDDFQSLDDKDFQQQYKSADKKMLLDVRQKHEFDKEKIHQAMNMDILNPAFEEKIKHFDRSKTYFIYCQSGGRSKKACRKMSKLGFENLINLKRGIVSYTGKTV